MTLQLNGSGTITGLAVGGLPDGSVNNADLAADVATALTYDDTNIRKDLSTLALQTAVDTNRKAYNLANSFVDQFEDDTGIGSHTTSDRSTDEYVDSTTTTGTAFNFKDSGTHGRPVMYGLTEKQTQVTGSTTDNWTNDSVKINDNAARQSAAWPDFLFDTNYDFKCYGANYVDTDGTVNQRGNTVLSVVIYENSGTQPGKSPTSGGSSIFRSSGHSIGTASTSSYDFQGSNLGTFVFTSAYATAIGAASFGRVDQNGGDTATAVDYSTSKAGNGLVLSQKWSSSSDGDCQGILVDYDQSAATLVAGFLGSGESYHSTGVKYTVTNVPANAVVFVSWGIGNQSTVTQYLSLNRGTSKAESTGTIGTATINATGTVIGTANTASSSRTKVSGTFLYKNNAGTATIGTDLKIYFTCNGGTNWTEAASYTAGSDFSTGIKTIYLGETTCTAGTDVRYKAVWANQASGSKETQLHGIGVNY